MEKKIKFGCVAWGLPGGGYFGPQIAKEAGLDGIQLELGSYEWGYPLAQKQVQEAYLEEGNRLGIEYPSIVLNDVMDHEFIHGKDTENGKIAYDQMELAVQVAAEIGISKIMVPNFLGNLITEESHVEATKDALRFICEKAEKKDITVMTENALDYKEQIQLLKEINMPNLTIHFDTQNFRFNFNMDQCEQLEGLYPYMDSQLHVKDGINEPGGCLLGEGNTDFFPQMEILKKHGYEGWIIIENYYNLLPLRKCNEQNQMQIINKDLETLRIAKEAGLDGIQLELGSYEWGYPLAQKQVQEAYLEEGNRLGIEYPSIVLNDVMDHEFIHGKDTENGKIAYDQMELAVQVAAEIGISKIMVPNFLGNLITEESHVEATKDALRFICEKAEKKDITVMTENALDYKEQIQLLKEINMPNLTIHFDTQNFRFNFNMDQCEQLEGLYPYMDSQLHVKDGINEPGGCLLGEGNTDFFPQMEILKKHGYEGWIIIENYYNLLPLRKCNEQNQMQIINKDLETLRTVWGV